LKGIIDSPAYTTRPRPDLSGGSFVQKVPGPGTYDIDKNSNKIAFSFGGRTNMIGKNYLVPGPGNYNTVHSETERRNATYKIGSSTRDNKDINISFPGPGK